jgi:hypothetical protein
MEQLNSQQGGRTPDWQSGLLRATFFLAPGTPTAEPTWWQDVFGEPPETRTTQPRIGGLKEQGVVQGGLVALAIEPGRIDWTWTGRSGSTDIMSALPSLGSYADVIQHFSSWMQRWLELDTRPAVQRMAFGSLLLHPVASRQAGYRQLADYLPSVRLDAEHSQDFLYQINRPRASRTGPQGLTINRLSKWSVVVSTVSLSPSTPLIAEVSVTAQHISRLLELDINTSADYQDSFPSEHLWPMFGELITLGSEIALEGDQP